MTQRIVAPAKLTRSLRIVGVRADGYHLLESEMVSISLADELAFDHGDSVEFIDATRGRAAVPTTPDNLVIKALRAVDRRARVQVTKNIPVGGGLGGGSTNAGAVLRWANCDDLGVAATIGADVAFCVHGGRAMVRGIGEQLEALPFLPLTFTLVIPPFGVSTPAVYAAWDALGGPTSDGPNDLEPAALVVEPRLLTWRDQLGEVSGKNPVLAGSGSTWFVEGEYEGDDLVVVHTVPAL